MTTLESIIGSQYDVLGTTIHALPKELLLTEVGNLFLDHRPNQIITANALLLLEAQKNSALKRACDDSRLVLPESRGVRWAFKRLGYPSIRPVAGVDLAYYLCQKAAERSLSVFLIGGKPGIAERASHTLLKKIPSLKVVGIRDGFFKKEDEPALINQVNESGADIVLVALGMPKQDIWINQSLPHFSKGIFMGVGGTFDVWAGEVKRAPVWIQKCGFEWFFRWIQEPWRWKRMVQLPIFALRVIEQSLNQ